MSKASLADNGFTVEERWALLMLSLLWIRVSCLSITVYSPCPIVDGGETVRSAGDSWSLSTVQGLALFSHIDDEVSLFGGKRV